MVCLSFVIPANPMVQPVALLLLAKECSTFRLLLCVMPAATLAVLKCSFRASPRSAAQPGHTLPHALLQLQPAMGYLPTQPLPTDRCLLLLLLLPADQLHPPQQQSRPLAVLQTHFHASLHSESSAVRKQKKVESHRHAPRHWPTCGA